MHGCLPAKGIWGKLGLPALRRQALLCENPSLIIGLWGFCFSCHF